MSRELSDKLDNAVFGSGPHHPTPGEWYLDPRDPGIVLGKGGRVVADCRVRPGPTEENHANARRIVEMARRR